MACIILFAQPLAMATTQLARVVQYDNVSTSQLDNKVKRSSPSMSWVVVTDKHGNRKLQILWTPSEDLL